MLKKFGAIFLCAAMLTFQAVSEAPPELRLRYDPYQGKVGISFSGGIKNGDLKVLVTKDTEKIGQFQATDEFQYIRQVSADAGGGLAVAVEMPESAQSGKYAAVVTQGGQSVSREFYHAKAEEAQRAFSLLIKDADHAGFAAAVDKAGAALGLDLDSFHAKAAKITDYYFQFAETVTEVNGFYEAYYAAVVAAYTAGEPSTAIIENILYENSLAVKINLDMLQGEALKNKVYGRFSNGGYATKPMSKQYMEWVCLSELEGQLNWQDYEKLLFIKYKDYLKLPTADYEKLTYPENAIRAVMNQAYHSVPDLKKAFAQAVEQAKGSSKPSSNGGGGGNTSGTTGDVSFPLASPQPPQPTPQPEGGYFTDVPPDSWAYEAVSELYKNKIISGVAEGIFAPEQLITRAQFAKLLAEAFLKETQTAGASFPDVSESEWYAPYIGKLHAAGIMTGDAAGNMQPEIEITRQDMAAMIYRTCNAVGKTLQAERPQISFADDAQIADYARENVYALYAAGIINGKTDTAFAPLEPATRAEAAKMIYETIRK